MEGTSDANNPTNKVIANKGTSFCQMISKGLNDILKSSCAMLEI